MIRTASVWHGKDGYVLRVEDVPAWAYAADAVNNAVIGAACAWSRGWACPLCLCQKCEWTFRIGWGREEDGLLRHSLGGLLFWLGQRGGRFCLNRVTLRYERPLSFEEVCEHFPDSRTEWDDDGEMCVRGVLVNVNPRESGAQITDEINADPAEVARLRAARQHAREGDVVTR